MIVFQHQKIWNREKCIIHKQALSTIHYAVASVIKLCKKLFIKKNDARFFAINFFLTTYVMKNFFACFFVYAFLRDNKIWPF